MLFQVQAPKSAQGKAFTAGFCVDAKGNVWVAAPIIRWMEDKPLTFIVSYCKNKGWNLVHVPE